MRQRGVKARIAGINHNNTMSTKRESSFSVFSAFSVVISLLPLRSLFEFDFPRFSGIIGDLDYTTEGLSICAAVGPDYCIAFGVLFRSFSGHLYRHQHQ